MGAYIFDGRAFAGKLLDMVAARVVGLKKKGINPKLVSIIVGDDPASVLYVNLKKKAAERMGCGLLVVGCREETKTKEIVEKIKRFNTDNTVHGIMIQLPLPERLSIEDRDQIINSISKEKDVDGLKDDSNFIAPTAKAVLEIINLAIKVTPLKVRPCKVVVIGAGGFEGRKIIRLLGKEKYHVIGLVKGAERFEETIRTSDVVISVTGNPDLIRSDMVKEGVILIDVGSPKGDIEKEAYQKASFVSPVPGGVGPVTIACLMENLVRAASEEAGKSYAIQNS
ncbi:hypothetical protein A3A76_05845 [Candidatus Woesebacteria bacterium RIFCSPLOWO2_01_FULL_39_23]|uniref:Bifunctional protein FolD n=1 Tax=Candidatus Woesebacteria bacterium RIFCSPHIGHO2_01_FULL_40_22 TaxID=1802499 RepID=A0A1F7YHZ7_9BACT|nr:MAG: hypothetical protein A2141_02540 [Candidatus Woesebacteria bacterium RBG_16_40_11]OGM26923.1 MAG: hypothetical protein A2628_05785 [Candidatus Woesebacteria bacterium RIFCSPHIGHO2_01_FULL_40_22]OGM37333.1 MAG: hypothetical protein A3E41_04185 [Candidatus Woesebacteria bacterium RIFCSPHIGHO2_12_FULL_38_9]OGM63198.1 MAG: hypothetical protein A3A76_05845 [Candidatus Woesebacteria bacterium RIFCSPLOWO2_01_FULL_39_23]